MNKYILVGASQIATQWDGSRYDIQPNEIITQITNRKLKSNLFKVESDERVIMVDKTILNRGNFKEVD